MVPKLGCDCHLPDPFQIFIHQYSITDIVQPQQLTVM